jgi:5-methyltetrahydropteroyltriglutamate--homocysteine methyltransferase
VPRQSMSANVSLTSTARRNPPFRAEHVGSLLRPDPLREERQRIQGDMARPVVGRLDVAELRDLEDAAIREAVDQQEEAGLRVITDGELRRRTWWQNFVAALDGTEIRIGEVALKFSNASGHTFLAPAPYVTGRLKRLSGITTDEFQFTSSLTEQEVKVTLPSPTVLHFYGGRAAIDKHTYPDLDTFWADTIEVYRAEIDELATLGCRYVQLDEVHIACLCDENIRSALRERGDDPDDLLRIYAQVINAIVASRPKEMTIGMHLCKGNNQGHWLAEGDYAPVAEILFNDIEVDAYFLEYDSERAGGFEPLKHLPSGKTAVLGLVSTKTPNMEPIEHLQRRVEAASRFAPLDQLCLSPQCGFASNFLGNPLTMDQQWNKLKLVVQAATKIWGSA